MKNTFICSVFILLPALAWCQYVLPEVEGFGAEGNFIYGFEICLRNHMNLATPDTKEKHDLLTQFLDEKQIVRTWIAGNDMGEEGRFRWISNGHRITKYFWHKTQPDNWKTNENCVEIRKDQVWAWNDIDCNTKYPIVCEQQFDLDIRGQWDTEKAGVKKE